MPRMIIESRLKVGYLSYGLFSFFSLFPFSHGEDGLTLDVCTSIRLGLINDIMTV